MTPAPAAPLSAPPVSRRALLGAALTTAAATLSTSLLGSRCEAHANAGLVTPPQTPPPTRLTLDDGRSRSLREQLIDRVTALQLIFTSCQATCPIQGAIFAQGTRALGDQVRNAQWLSISIDPAHDDPALLRAWIARFGGHPRWHAARPDPRDLDALFDFLKARSRGADRHTAQVYFFDPGGQLVLRSVDFPPAAEIARVLRDLGARA